MIGIVAPQLELEDGSWVNRHIKTSTIRGATTAAPDDVVVLDLTYPKFLICFCNVLVFNDCVSDGTTKSMHSIYRNYLQLKCLTILYISASGYG